MTDDIESKIEQAQSRIAAVLKELEQKTGLLVKAVHLESIDVTTFEDAIRKERICVRIETYRMPSHEWD